MSSVELGPAGLAAAGTLAALAFGTASASGLAAGTPVSVCALRPRRSGRCASRAHWVSDERSGYRSELARASGTNDLAC